MNSPRIVPAVHGLEAVDPDPTFEIEFAQDLARRCDPAEILALFRRFDWGDGHLDNLMRRTCVRALARRCGSGLRIGPGVGLRHPETFEIGDGVVIGEQAVIQGRYDGRCVIGDKVWIGPQAFLDARNVVVGDYVGWGPGAKLLGSKHTGVPVDIPIIATDLAIAPVVIGRGSIVGAGAVVTRNVPAYAKVAGCPAEVIGYRGTFEAAAGADR